MAETPAAVLRTLALCDQVEADVRSGRRADAHAALARLRVRARAGTGWAAGLLARAEALLASDRDAQAHYLRAIHLLEATTVDIEAGRAWLLYGEWLRRRARTRDAREALRAARDRLDACGATTLADRARTELAAAGDSGRRGSSDMGRRGGGLTSQEDAIARLAGRGATNDEIAGHLYLSVNTVEYHLKKIFRKLDITSRRSLRPKIPPT